VSAYLFKQTFAIPGSVFLNALAGAVFGLKTGIKKLELVSKAFNYLYETLIVILFISFHCNKKFITKSPVKLFCFLALKDLLFSGFCLVCTLTAVGATLCYLLARLVGQDLALKYFPSKISAFKKKLDENYDRLVRSVRQYIVQFI
jgi:hypothetical protein